MFSTLLMQIRNQLTHTRLKEDLIEHIWQKFSTQQHQPDQEWSLINVILLAIVLLFHCTLFVIVSEIRQLYFYSLFIHTLQKKKVQLCTDQMLQTQTR